MSPELIAGRLLEELLEAEATNPEPGEAGYSAPILRLLASAERGHLSRSFVERYCAPGEIVFYEGEIGEAMYLIWSGRAVILKGDLESPVIVAFRKPGEIFGEMALLENQPRSATVVALDHLRLLEINRLRFDVLLREAPHVSRGIMEVLSSRLRRMTDELSSGEQSEKRLSRQLMDLESEKNRLEELQRLRQETTDLIIHDLRNPLGAVSVSLKMLNLLLPADVLAANRELLEIAQSGCDQMQNLVESLLEVSRMERGDMPFNIAPTDLRYLIEDLVARTTILTRTGVSLQSCLPADLPPVLADTEKIERVLANLVDNAVKFSPEGGKILIEADAEDGCMQIRVRDEGPGIPAEERERIFERFTQTGPARKRRRGYGLGLTYCRLAIERHGGRIWVEPSADGPGSCFIFSLPLHLELQGAQATGCP